MEDEYNQGVDSSSSLGALSVAVVVALNVFFLRYRVPNNVTCSLPNCARCSRQRQTKEDLLRKLSLFLDNNEGWKWRLSELIDSMDNRNNIVQHIYSISGYESPIKRTDIESNCSSTSVPVIWSLPSLRQVPFWYKHDHNDMRMLFAALEDPALHEDLQREYSDISVLGSPHWHVNNTLAGQWRVFYLYNQGRKIEANCQLCPIATGTVERLDNFLKGNLFSFAMFSVLRPGSAIEPHTGPCNYRLRCHLSLHAPPGYFLQVARTTVEWKTGQVFVFDDSLVHRVWHSPQDSVHHISDTPTHSGCRVVLIVDIWHPQVELLERRALNAMFPP